MPYLPCHAHPSPKQHRVKPGTVSQIVQAFQEGLLHIVKPTGVYSMCIITFDRERLSNDKDNSSNNDSPDG